MARFRLTREAEADFDGIGAYTLENWGPDQAVSYLEALDAAFATLARIPDLGRERNDLRTGLKMWSCNRHVIFFRRDTAGNVEILRILHGRMDFERHF